MIFGGRRKNVLEPALLGSNIFPWRDIYFFSRFILKLEKTRCLSATDVSCGVWWNTSEMSRVLKTPEHVGPVRFFPSVSECHCKSELRPITGEMSGNKLRGSTCDCWDAGAVLQLSSIESHSLCWFKETKKVSWTGFFYNYLSTNLKNQYGAPLSGAIYICFRCTCLHMNSSHWNKLSTDSERVFLIYRFAA